mmetsp:Transcript_6352/g.22650  ORF Transcript_6352/g.22650 Transcript_6352/m.22650 type:complete len:237 (+) Transcript_6352:853-1563(+)
MARGTHAAHGRARPRLRQTQRVNEEIHRLGVRESRLVNVKKLGTPTVADITASATGTTAAALRCDGCARAPTTAGASRRNAVVVARWQVAQQRRQRFERYQHVLILNRRRRFRVGRLERRGFFALGLLRRRRTRNGGEVAGDRLRRVVAFVTRRDSTQRRQCAWKAIVGSRTRLLGAHADDLGQGGQEGDPHMAGRQCPRQHVHERLDAVSHRRARRVAMNVQGAERRDEQIKERA